MKTSSIIYSKTFSLVNYENEKIGVEIVIQKGDDVQKAIQKARNFVEFNHKLNGLNSELAQQEHIINNPDDFTGVQVRCAREKRDQLLNKITEGTQLFTQ